LTLTGRLFDGRSSAPREVAVELEAGGQLRLRTDAWHATYALRDFAVSERVGNIPRRLTFTDGTACELDDNDALDAWLAAAGRRSFEQRVHGLERRWAWAAGAVLFALLGGWLFIARGLPALSQRAVTLLPRSVDQYIGKNGLQLMDQSVFKPTTLDPARVAQLRTLFAGVAADAHVPGMRLELRHGGRMGANAFALPSGIVIMTDELVALAQDDRELEAVLAHEVGHVLNRHALRMLVQSSSTALIMAGVIGDVSSVSSLVSSLPVVLVNARYSRAFEAQADDYAFTWMDAHHVDRHFFNDILQRLEAQSGTAQDSGVISYFDSHPRTAERLRKAGSPDAGVRH
jgi:Zn-dependent protease with chaperone function